MMDCGECNERRVNLGNPSTRCPACRKDAEIARLRAEVERLTRERDEALGRACDACTDETGSRTGWCENAVEGRYVCPCITETPAGTELIAQRDTAEARVAELEAALRPFAAFAPLWRKEPCMFADIGRYGPDTKINVYGEGRVDEVAITIGDYDRARALLSPKPAPKPCADHGTFPHPRCPDCRGEGKK